MANKPWVLDRGRRELLTQIHQWHFVATELTLFLDTHWDNREALRDYNEAVQRLHQAVEEYERRYGPLMAHGHSPSPYPWAWIEEPWPWQIGL
ncbi:MAG: spore coat protein CotJB [Clostridia bacterium]|nr:MAG: spore coat protein CotJB [Clostridia bacterium]